MGTLLVIVPDRLSEIISKGEFTPRYYNPGNLFDEVHILMTNDDKVDSDKLQETVGNASLHIHNLPSGKGLFYRSLGWRPWLLKSWSKPAVALAEKIGPSLIRCHGNLLNAFLANRIKSVLGIPYVVSMHINPDEDVRGRAVGLKNLIFSRGMEKLERIGLVGADIVLPVYKPIVPYLERMNIKRYEVAYNALNSLFLGKKENYGLHHPVRVISVGRQIKEKNPENIIRAIKLLPGVHLTLVGDGDYHYYLQNLVRECQMQDQVTFYQALPNDVLCRQLPDYDIFAVHTEYFEISKSVLEPLLTGMPVVINQRIGKPVPELQGDFLMMVNNTVDDYYSAFKRLIDDDQYRESLGRRAYKHAQERWAPAKTEEKFVEIYKRVMAYSGIT